MPKFCSNLSMMFQEVDFPARFEAAARAGFKGVEYLFPYDYEVNQLVDLLRENNLQQVLHNLPAGNWGEGERGIAILPGRVGEFQDGVEKAITYANALGCRQVNVLSGIAPQGLDPATLRQTLVDNLKFAAGELDKHDIRLIVEAINTRDIPGFFLCGTQQTMEVIRATGSDNIQLQYDIYHMQIMEGDLAPTIERYADHIGHIQVADTPGRHEPGTGEINYPFLFDFLDRIGYAGWIGCEYVPAATTTEGLGWFEPYR